MFHIGRNMARAIVSTIAPRTSMKIGSIIVERFWMI
jgi:hypothetical protein